MSALRAMCYLGDSAIGVFGTKTGAVAPSSDKLLLSFIVGVVVALRKVQRSRLLTYDGGTSVPGYDQ